MKVVGLRRVFEKVNFVTSAKTLCRSFGVVEVTRQGGKREPLDKAVAFQIGKNGMILSFEVLECGCLVNLVPILKG